MEAKGEASENPSDLKNSRAIKGMAKDVVHIIETMGNILEDTY